MWSSFLGSHRVKKSLGSSYHPTQQLSVTTILEKVTDKKMCLPTEFSVSSAYLNTGNYQWKPNRDHIITAIFFCGESS